MSKQRQLDNHVSARFVEELIRGMGHDIGAPARHIVYFAQMLSDQDTDMPSEENYQRLITMIHDSGKQIQDMLASLAKLSRLSVRSAESAQLNLRAIFDKQIDFHRKHTAPKEAQVAATINENWPTVLGSEDHWHTLFSSLLENACKFQPRDTEHAIQIVARCECVRSELTFVLEDNGIGVRETKLGEISRPFKRLHAVDEYPGLGMGLAYCDFIAELNGASLDLDQSPLGGLRVTYHHANIQTVTPNITRINKG